MTRALGIGLLTALALGALYLAVRPAPEPAGPAPTGATAAPAAGAAGPAARREFEWIVGAGRLVSGAAVIRVQQGDDVVLRVRSDHADELHLHGYDLRARLEPGATAELAFHADRSGRFELELHEAHAELGALEVHPR